MRRHGFLVVLALLLAACEPDGDDKAVRADGPAETSTTAASTTAPSTTAASTTAASTKTSTTTTSTTTTTVTPNPVATTTTTARPRPRPTTTITAKPAPAQATSSCHTSYRRTCIPPDVSDADCAGGSGNGPWYVQEKNIAVVGPDVFDLDRDGNGVGCQT